MFGLYSRYRFIATTRRNTTSSSLSSWRSRFRETLVFTVSLLLPDGKGSVLILVSVSGFCDESFLTTWSLWCSGDGSVFTPLLTCFVGSGCSRRAAVAFALQSMQEHWLPLFRNNSLCFLENADAGRDFAHREHVTLTDEFSDVTCGQQTLQ